MIGAERLHSVLTDPLGYRYTKNTSQTDEAFVTHYQTHTAYISQVFHVLCLHVWAVPCLVLVDSSLAVLYWVISCFLAVFTEVSPVKLEDSFNPLFIWPGLAECGDFMISCRFHASITCKTRRFVQPIVHLTECGGFMLSCRIHFITVPLLKAAGSFMAIVYSAWQVRKLVNTERSASRRSFHTPSGADQHYWSISTDVCQGDVSRGRPASTHTDHWWKYKDAPIQSFELFAHRRFCCSWRLLLQISK